MASEINLVFLLVGSGQSKSYSTVRLDARVPRAAVENADFKN
jgi:hypothetical protein